MGSDRPADEAFRLLSDEIRLDILRAVALAQHEVSGAAVAAPSFSDIYERVDVDNTSKLSYHLGELTGTFLRKHDGGYAFTHAGERVVRFVLAENHRRPAEFGRIDAAGNCLFCGAARLQATLEGQFFMIRCGACDRPAFSYRVTPAQVRAHEEGDLVEAVRGEQAGDFLKMRQGVCPDCAGRLETEVRAIDEAPEYEGLPASFGTFSECQECLRCLGVPLTHAAVYHPESVAFHWEHGVDILGTGVWEFHRYLREGRWTDERVDDDPETYRVDLRRDDASLRLFLDGSAAVTRTERIQRRDHGGGDG
ncbi:helix-turn-helix domain-containing protein [Haloglomus halophilum]|uniref:helix-turn-helix domain-containing protein n=1 Tax=Haloglomus halophilum TaxID=2962672 RepID=UPI0020C99125|nr:helix-turn-helix domain-containing protein [Haloglomus halophilum]